MFVKSQFHKHKEISTKNNEISRTNNQSDDTLLTI